MSRELSPIESALPKSSPNEQSATAAYIAQARQQHAVSSDGIEIDDSPDVSVAEGGAWVAAWVWVDQEEAGLCGKKRARIAQA